MKKLVLTALAAVLLPTLVLAQGTISFGSSGANHYLVYENLTMAAGVQAELWWSPDNVVSYTQIATAQTGVGPAAGYIAPAVTVVTPSPGGATPWFYVAGVDGIYAGQSPAFQSGPLGNPSGQPPTTAPTLDGWTSPVTLTPIPEPSTLALAGLAVGALVLFRRRK